MKTTIEQIAELEIALNVAKVSELGQAVQRRYSISEAWEDFSPDREGWDNSTFYYRIKPAPKVIWVNEFKNGDICFSHFEKEADHICQTNGLSIGPPTKYIGEIK
ncbi:hypothetical protein KAR91_16620 [Candidatus Pacearchaeota archaeon]|nr:hypothetical protein [Candidatus Pacearchaeota archaeon]